MLLAIRNKMFNIIKNGQLILPVFFNIFLFFIILQLNSCALAKNIFSKEPVISNSRFADYSYMDFNDYKNQLKNLHNEFMNDNSLKTLPLNLYMKNFLKEVFYKLKASSELIFTEDIEPEFYIIKSNLPYHFSLPGYKFFMTSALIEKYVDHEVMLASFLSYDMVRSEKVIYNKFSIIPTGSLSIEKVVSMLRLSVEIKSELHKWSYYVLKRAGYEADLYLSWLQKINRNSLDFSLMLGDVRSISREEFLFKEFLIKEFEYNKIDIQAKNSSKGFYRFLNETKRL